MTLPHIAFVMLSTGWAWADFAAGANPRPKVAVEPPTSTGVLDRILLEESSASAGKHAGSLPIKSQMPAGCPCIICKCGDCQCENKTPQPQPQPQPAPKPAPEIDQEPVKQWYDITNQPGWQGFGAKNADGMVIVEQWRPIAKTSAMTRACTTRR